MQQGGWNAPQGQPNRPNNPYVPVQQGLQSPGFGQRQPQQLATNFDFNKISEMPTKYPRL